MRRVRSTAFRGRKGVNPWLQQPTNTKPRMGRHEKRRELMSLWENLKRGGPENAVEVIQKELCVSN